MNLIDEFTRAPSQLSRMALADVTRSRLASLSVILKGVPDSGSPSMAQQLRARYADVFRQRLDGALQDIEFGFINGRKVSTAQERESERVLDNMLEDRVILVKKDGAVEKENVPALVMKGKIQIHDVSLPIEAGDHLLRKLPSGLVEDYIVNDPVLHSGLGHKFFSIHVRRGSAPTANEKSVIQNITNIFHGAHSRVNINSTDNSTNVSNQFSTEKLRDLLNQIRPAITGLPAMQQQTIVAPLDILESEIQSGGPSTSKVAAALQSIKTIAEGATGNLIAAGIVGLVQPLLSQSGLG